MGWPFSPASTDSSQAVSNRNVCLTLKKRPLDFARLVLRRTPLAGFYSFFLIVLNLPVNDSGFCFASPRGSQGPQDKFMYRRFPETSPDQQNSTNHLSPCSQKSKLRVLPIEQQVRHQRETLESVLSSVLRSEDRELDQVLRALDDLSNILKSRDFDSAQAEEALKRAAVWAVQKSLLDREVRSLAITDDLTGFFNRRGFLAAAAQQLRLAHRDGRSVLLLFCDVDRLKNINDSFGHREGDFALIRAADALEETFRDSDVLARLGGDEFAALAWEASIPDTQVILSRMEKNLEKANADERRYKLRLSVGVARYDPATPVTLGELMALADRDMYRHKNGRAYAAGAG